MIEQSSIENLLAAVNIVDVIGKDVKLQKKGASHKACCPFHNEQTPSFVVSESKQIFKCFGCGEGGNVFRYLMLKTGGTFPEVVRQLAADYSVDLGFSTQYNKEEYQALQNQREQLLYVNEVAARYFASQLPLHPHANEYVLKRMTIEDAGQWNLGYAPDGWENLLTHFRQLGVKEEMFLATGLISESKKNGMLHDYFRNRIIFPIHNTAGRVIAFAGRVIKLAEGEPKYINSPETPLYSKSQILFGLNHSWNAIREADRCFLVEGYTDVIAMHRAGFTNCVASCGTSVTPDHLKLIRRYTKNLTLMSDGDAAGKKSCLKTGQLALSTGLNVSTVALPAKSDPFDLINHYHEPILQS